HAATITMTRTNWRLMDLAEDEAILNMVFDAIGFDRTAVEQEIIAHDCIKAGLSEYRSLKTLMLSKVQKNGTFAPVWILNLCVAFMQKIIVNYCEIIVRTVFEKSLLFITFSFALLYSIISQQTRL
ncbi:hypothetical protein ACJX0J_027540, partial [Zea mays]